MIPLDCCSRNENLILRELQTQEDEENNQQKMRREYNYIKPEGCLTKGD